MRRIGLVQAWDGALPEAKPMMGFVNIISKDFHLHLKAGAVARWRKLGDDQDVELHAEGADGAIIGLVLRGKADAFANVPHVMDMTAHD
jgi:putative heme degradation protein